MERLTERTGEGQVIPRMDLRSNGHKKCMERLGEYEDTGLTPEEIMDGKLFTVFINWIPVEERLPSDPEEWRAETDDLEEYIVMIDGAEEPTVLYYAGDGEWYRDGELYRVIAWMPLPEPYKLGK